jgi:uncharacterized membrane protein YhaH (DUF805 family)
VQRYDRARFVAWGLVSAGNAVALALYALNLATHGRGPAANLQPVLYVLIGICLLELLSAAVMRGHDFGRPGWQVVLLLLVAGPLAPALLFLLAYARGEPGPNRFGAPPKPPDFMVWLRMAGTLTMPWIIFAGAVALVRP